MHRHGLYFTGKQAFESNIRVILSTSNFDTVIKPLAFKQGNQA